MPQKPKKMVFTYNKVLKMQKLRFDFSIFRNMKPNLVLGNHEYIIIQYMR